MSYRVKAGINPELIKKNKEKENEVKKTGILVLFEIEGMPKDEILKYLGLTIEDNYLILEGKKIPIDAIEMVVPDKNGKFKVLIDPLEVSDYFSDLDENEDEENKKEE